MSQIKNILRNYWPIFLFLVFSFILRIYKLEELFYFTYDESIPAFVGRRMFLWGHIPLIGGVSPFGVHLTPYFYWFLAGILAIGNFNPIIWGMVGAVLSIVTTFLMYIVGNSFANKKVGLTAAIFWAFSLLANIYDRHLLALYPGPLLSLVVIYSIFKIKKGSENFVYILSLALIIGISADPSNLVFVVFSVLIWIFFKLPISKKTIIAIFLVLLSLIPLIVFDLKHNFANTRPFLEFWSRSDNNPSFNPNKLINNFLLFPYAFSRLIYTFGDNEIAKQYSYSSIFVEEKYNSIPPVFVIISTLLLISFTIYSLRNKINYGWNIISILIIIYFLGIQLYGTIFKADIFEHYLSGLFAVFLLIFAKIVSAFPKKLWLFLISIFVIFNLSKLLVTKNSLGLTYKKQAIEFVMGNVGDKEFSIESLSTNWRYSGYRYLFTVFGREPVKSYVDSTVGYLYGTTEISKEHPNTIVAFVIHDFSEETQDFYRRYNFFKIHEKNHSTFGKIEVIIMDNSSKWFENVGN